MDRWLGRHAERIYTLLRIVAGLLFACHGAQKLFGAFGGQVMTSNPMMLAAGIIEFAGGLLIAVGFLTSWAAFLASGQMALAYFMVHAKGGFWPIVNKGELAVLFCFLFLYIAARGAGPYSVDAAMRKR
jgi:putative oxidoreductase